jgi:hypothetical protein
MKQQAVITGKKVHDVGYRVYLLQKALELGFRKFNARNQVKDGVQQIIVQYEGEPEIIDAYGAIIRTEHPPDAEISDISFGNYEGYVISITDYMHVIQVEQLSKGIPAIISIDKKQDKMLEKQDQMLGKQDLMLGRQDKMLQKMDGMETSITGEIHDLRTDLRSHLDQRLSVIEQDIQQIKTKIGLT